MRFVLQPLDQPHGHQRRTAPEEDPTVSAARRVRFDAAPSSRHSSGRPTGVAWLGAFGEALTVVPTF